MATQEFYIDYFDKKYLDSQFPNRKNTPEFQLAEGGVGAMSLGGGDPNEKPYPESHVISSSKNFPSLALSVLRHLKKPESLRSTYQITFSENASAQIGKTGEKVLEEILALHNDFVTPRRTR
jgi:hypothetical protein